MSYSLGQYAKAKHFSAETITARTIDVETLTEGTHMGSHVKIGDTPTQNTASIHQTGSLLHVNYPYYLNVVAGAVQDASAVLTLTTSGTHYLQANDVVVLENVSNGLADIEAGEMNGQRTLGAGTVGSTLRVILDRAAIASESDSNFTCGVHGVQYKSLDLAKNETTWTHSSTLPTPAHSNNAPAAWAPY